jgi:hypothetical protein
LDPPTSSSLADEWVSASHLDVDGNFRPLAAAAYDKSMARADGRRRARWPIWLAAGMLFGLAIGFAFGLARPRART